MGLRRTTHCLTRRSAFTLIDVLVVITIIGIAAAVVVPQMIRPGTLNAQAGARMIIADLLYAQNDAIAKQQVRRVVFDPTNNRYQVTDGNDQVLTNEQIGGPYLIDFSSDDRIKNVTLATTDFNGQTVITFDEMGSPSAGGTIELTSGSRHYRITVAPFTGRVTVESL